MLLLVLLEVCAFTIDSLNPPCILAKATGGIIRSASYIHIIPPAFFQNATGGIIRTAIPQGGITCSLGGKNANHQNGG